jgi:hypothetical protein
MIAFSAVWVIFMIDKDLILSRLLSLIQVHELLMSKNHIVNNQYTLTNSCQSISANTDPQLAIRTPALFIS